MWFWLFGCLYILFSFMIRPPKSDSVIDIVFDDGDLKDIKIDIEIE